MLDKRKIMAAAEYVSVLPSYSFNRNSIVGPIEMWETIDSTNTHAMQIAKAGAIDGTAIISEEQTGGRGRLGRSFYSPKKTGLYLSYIVRKRFDRLKMTGDIPALLTSMAGVVTAQAIFDITGIDTRLKWVNDIYIGEKKAGGILTEGSYIDDKLEFAVIGIGVNVFEPADGFPDDLKNTAAALVSENDQITSQNSMRNDGLSPVKSPVMLSSAMSPAAAIPSGRFPLAQNSNYLRENLAGLIIGGMRNWLHELEIDPDQTKERLYTQYYARFKWMIGRKVGIIDRNSGNITPMTVCGLTRNYELAAIGDSEDNTNTGIEGGSQSDTASSPGVSFLRSEEVIYFNSLNSSDKAE